MKWKKSFKCVINKWGWLDGLKKCDDALIENLKVERGQLRLEGGGLKMLNKWANGMAPHDEEDGAWRRCSTWSVGWKGHGGKMVVLIDVL